LELTLPSDLTWWLTDPGLVTDTTGYLADEHLSPPARRFTSSDAEVSDQLLRVRTIDEFLAAHGNSIPAAELGQALQERIDGSPAEVTVQWRGVRESLSAALVAAIAADAEPALRADITRLLLVIGLVELLASEPDRLADPDGVFWALRWRDIVLPPFLLEYPGRPHSILARPPGVSDLYVVREEWKCYEAGEIAHIENVLKGELKTRLHERTDETETTITQEQEKTQFNERDSQTTDRFETREEADSDASLAFHIDGKVDTSGQYGPTHVDTHVGGTFDYSLHESNRRAVNQATETVTRAVTRIEEKTREQRVTRTLTRIHEQDDHTLDNKEGHAHVVGIYRWVDKIQRVQVFRYPHRLLFEFEIPEPGSFVRWLLARPPAGVSKLNPKSFTDTGEEDGKPLTANLVGWEGEKDTLSYLTLGRRYFAKGLTGPPADKFVFADLKDPAPDFAPENKPPSYTTASVTVPDDYEAYAFRIYTVATNAAPLGPGKPSGWLEVVVGTDFPSLDVDDNNPAHIYRFQGTNVFRDMTATTFRQAINGTFPILLATDDLSGLLATVQIVCRPSASKIAAWRQATYDLIQQAYWDLKNQYDEEIARRAIQAGVEIVGDSPVRNAQVVTEELKKFVIEMLSGKRFTGRPAIAPAPDAPTYATDQPTVELDAAAAASAEIQFLEQAFEWENLTYVLYPYFWSASAKWVELARIKSPDPLFDQFLRSGSARVVIPARPGFEAQAHLYTNFGVLWGGGPVPVPDDDLYLSVADEIRAQQQPAADGEPGDSWEVRLPTTLIYLEPPGTTLPLTNTNATLPVPGKP
jgi:hypothetical protein